MAVELKALGEQLQEQLRGIVALQPPQPPQPPPEYPRDERIEWLERAISEDEPEVLQRHGARVRACGERELLGWCAEFDAARRSSASAGDATRAPTRSSCRRRRARG